MNRGTVKWFNDVKGYGFITDETGNDVFVHYSNIRMEGRKTLKQDDVVEFEIGKGTDGREQAVNVQILYLHLGNGCSQYLSENLKTGCVVIKIEYDNDKNIEEVTSYANDVNEKSSYGCYVENKEQLSLSVIVERMSPIYKDNMWDIDTDVQSIISFEEFEKEISNRDNCSIYISRENADISDFGGALELEFLEMLKVNS
jgi:CspA family cold shock protein